MICTTAGSTSDMVANGTFTLVQRSTGQTWSFAVGEGNARTIADLEADLNGIDGAGGGFKVTANGSLANSPLITATEDFGDFDPDAFMEDLGGSADMGMMDGGMMGGGMMDGMHS